MENIVQKQNSAHVHAYNAIKYILFGNKLKKKETVQQVLPNNVSKSAGISSQLAEQRKDNQAGNYGKKGKKKFRDIKDFQEKKKEKEGTLSQSDYSD